MKKILIALVLGTINLAFAQDVQNVTEVLLDLNQLKSTVTNNASGGTYAINLPISDGSFVSFEAERSDIIQNQPSDISTIKAVNNELGITYRLSITPSGISGMMKQGNSYFVLEPKDTKLNQYIIYNLNDSGQGTCGTNGPDKENLVNENGQVLSAGLFPIGAQLRKYRFAGSATGEMTAAYGSQAAARDRIVAIMNAANLIYELEAAIRFELITKTTDLTLIFTDPNTDPFNVNPNFGSAGDAQAGFDILNGNSTLLYNEYDTGHTFNNISGGGARGTGGGSPCVNNSKSTGWTEFGTASSLGLIVGLFAHEVGHQFSAWHTYNATGGSGSNPTFCTGGWDSQTAVEPGSGTTIMGYGGNCSNNTSGTLSSYVLTSPNNESYFHTRSLDQIFTKMATVSNCFVQSATGNTPPVASVGGAVTIPKGTPFTLIGSATDADGDNLSYVWNQMDVATNNDQGALGSAINVIGAYPAVNSTTAPLFRSRISTSPVRTFPDMSFILNNSNNPGDNEGEDLPQVARTMNFRLTVRDNKPNGGGLDSEALVVTVSNNGPLTLTSYAAPATLAAGATVPLTWAVNGTNALSANVKISLSVDGGASFPIILSASTPNDGAHSVQIPANTPASTDARIKVSNIGSTNYEWFDLNDGKLTITSACLAATKQICPTNTVSGAAGSAGFNLNLTSVNGTTLASKSYFTDFSTTSNKAFHSYADAAKTTCQAGGNSPASILQFQVTSSGMYNINMNNFTGAHISTSLNPTCGSFVSSNASDGSFSNGFSATLNECTTYYLFVHNFFSETNATLTFSGTGDIIQVIADPAGFSTTYVAINKNNGQISAVSATSDFTSLGGGNFVVKGLNYQNGVNPATFVGGTESTAFSSGSCIAFSSNSKELNIVGSPCPNSVTLTSTANDITSGTQTFQSSNTASPGSIIATNKVTGGNTTYDAGKKVEMNPGFEAKNGAVFRAQIGGCN